MGTVCVFPLKPALQSECVGVHGWMRRGFSPAAGCWAAVCVRLYKSLSVLPLAEVQFQFEECFYCLVAVWVPCARVLPAPRTARVELQSHVGAQIPPQTLDLCPRRRRTAATLAARHISPFNVKTRRVWRSFFFLFLFYRGDSIAARLETQQQQQQQHKKSRA